MAGKQVIPYAPAVGGDGTLSEVGGRFIVGLLRAARARGIDVDSLCRSMELREAELDAHDAFISWTTCADLLEALEECAGGPDGLRRVGHAMMEPERVVRGGRVLRLAIGPSQIYPMMLRWSGPAAFPVVESSVERLDRHRIAVEIEIPEPHRACMAFFNGCLGSFEAAPRVLGLPDSVVEAELEPRRGRYVITPPPSTSLIARLHGLFALLRGSDLTLEELRAQHEAIQRQRAKLDAIRLELEEADHRFTQVFELSPVSMVIGALDGGSLLAANQAFLDQAGVTREEALSADVASLPLWRSVGHTAEVKAMIASKDGTRGTDFVFRDAQGRDRHGLVWSLVSKFGGVPSVLVQVLDVTDRREAELALEQSEARLRGTIEAVPDAIGLLSRDGTCLDAHLPSWVAEQRTGPDPVGLNLSEMGLQPEFESGLRDLLGRVLETGLLETLDFELPVGLGARHLEVRVARCGPDVAVCIVRDVTERHELEESLLQSQKLEAIGQLAGGVAHDFNNLLTVISGYTDQLRSDLPAGSPASEASEEILDATQRAARLTQQLLTFGRRQVVQQRRVELNTVVTGMRELLERLLGEHVSIRTDLCDEATTVRIDAGQLEQVLMNLALNARDAMPEGGELRFATRAASAMEFEAAGGSARAERFVCLSVVDDGRGMDEGTRLRIFEPFFTTKAPGVGTGLGLSTVYGIVTRFDGVIQVASRPGHGTTFEVYLPRVSGEAEVVSHRKRRERSGRGETILFVEDEAPLRKLVQTRLSAVGYTVLLASDGVDALQVSSRYSGEIHALVTDVVMPRMGGVELASELSRLRPGIRQLFISGHPGQQIPAKIRLVEKPFRLADLERALIEVLDG